MSEKPSRRAPAFLLYVDDFLGGTSEMSAEEVGGYIRLLCHQWAKGGLPNDPERLGRMAGLLGSPSLGYTVAKFTLCDDGQLRHPRLEALRSERDAFLLKQAESGKKGAEKRWRDRQANGNPNGKPIATPLATPMANGCPNDGSPSPSPSPINTPKAPKGAEPVGFDEFWKAYPKKVAKPAAMKAWAKLNPNDETFRKILESVKTQSASPDWLKDGGQFIPYPATYLNGRRWEDVFELPETKETLEEKLLAHRGCPSHVNRSNATPEDLAEYAEMLKRYKALP